MRFALSALFVVAAATGARAETIPDCAGAVEVAHLPVVRVEQNGALILKDGRAALLEGIRLPAADRAPKAFADRALAALTEMAVGHDLTLTALRPKEDRYGRIRVQAFGDEWLQTALLRRGLARVDLAPDRGECASELYAAEREGRAARAGLWALPGYAIRTPASVGSGDNGAFEIIEGRVVDAEVRDGRAFLDFGADYRHDFTATISPDDMKTFRAGHADPRDWQGKNVRVRGIVELYGGRPEIELSSPLQVETVE
jgi:hypothetical protein